jgi:hypothetical protein
MVLECTFKIEASKGQVTGNSSHKIYVPGGIMPFPLDEFHIVCRGTKFGVKFSQ